MLVTCVLAGALAPTDAWAVPARPASWSLVNADLPVVEDGVLLFHFDPGDFIGGSPATLSPTVTDSLGATAPGTVEMLEISAEHAIFRFDAALGSGRSFSLSDPSGLLWGSFTTTGPFVSAAPVATVTATTGVQLQSLEQACCSGTTLQSPFGAASPGCVVLRAEQQPVLGVTAALAMDDSSSRQYLYRAVLTAPVQVEGAWRAASEASIGWTLASPDSADEYCVRVEAYGLLDGATSVLDERCAAHDQGVLGEVPPDDAAITTALDVRGCLIPPAQLEAAWCEVNRAACADATSPSQSACVQANFDATCGDHAPSDAGLDDLVQAGSGATTGGGGSGQAGSAAAGRGSDPDDPGNGSATLAGAAGMTGSEASMPSGGSSGCAVSARRASGPGWRPWLLAACVPLLLRRRRPAGRRARS